MTTVEWLKYKDAEATRFFNHSMKTTTQDLILDASLSASRAHAEIFTVVAQEKITLVAAERILDDLTKASCAMTVVVARLQGQPEPKVGA